jgi:hypothetical protein
MKRIVLLMLPLILIGCSAGTYQLPKDEYRERVRTLGVLPLMVDEGSTIRHPQREELITLLRRENVAKDERLVSILRDRKGYFDIREIKDDPQALYRRLVRGSALRGDGDAVYRRYHFDGSAAARLASENMVDGLLVVILNGVERVERRRDRAPFVTFLEAPYNSILVTAAVVLPSGEIAWEYSGEGGESFLPLQYADFLEADVNRTDEVRIKFISLEGLERTLSDPSKGILVRDEFPGVYLNLFQRISSALNPGLGSPLRGSR